MKFKVGDIVKVDDPIKEFIGVIEEIYTYKNEINYIMCRVNKIGYEISLLKIPTKLDLAVYYAELY